MNWTDIKNLAKIGLVLNLTVATLFFLAISVLIALSCPITLMFNLDPIFGSYVNNFVAAALLFGLATFVSWLTEILTKQWL